MLILVCWLVLVRAERPILFVLFLTVSPLTVTLALGGLEIALLPTLQQLQLTKTLVVVAHT
jgi:hypothetical protein